jgi:hypothetical protein
MALSIEDLRDIADNPDGADPTDRDTLADYIGRGTQPAPQAATLWPNAEVERIPEYNHGSAKNRVFVARTIAAYCRLTSRAYALREAGQVCRAIVLETTADSLYKTLPNWARW